MYLYIKYGSCYKTFKIISMKLKILEKLTDRDCQTIEADFEKLYDGLPIPLAVFLHWALALAYMIWQFLILVLVLVLSPLEYSLRLVDIIRPNWAKAKEIKITRGAIELHGNGLLIQNCYELQDFVNIDQSLPMFIENFILTYRKHYNTITYTQDFLFNKSLKQIICGMNRRRSLGDIFLICKHYYPNCTIHEVLTILVKLLEHHTISGSFCHTINKYVFHTDSNTYVRNDVVEYEGIDKFTKIIDAYKHE